MFGTQWTKRRRKAEHVAEDAWDNMRAAMGSKAKAVGKRTHGFADQAQSRVGATADEARKRANAAVDALTGRRPRTPWAWIAGAAMAGLLLGWAVAATGARALAGALDRHTPVDELDTLPAVPAAPPPVVGTTTPGTTLPR
jgi:ElaB/YqjD/DUF883 family membrane-anchored ribosome-binding protein